MDDAALAPFRIAEQLLEERRIDGAGTERVHADSPTGELDRDFPGERQDSSLGRRVRDLRGRRAHESHERRGVDDAAAAGAKERGDAVLAAEEDPLQVHAEHEVPRLLVGVEDRSVGVREHPRVVEEHVQLAIRLLGLRDHRADVVAPGDIGVDEMGAASRLFDLRDGLFPGVVRDFGNDDARPFAREEQRGLAPDPASGARDQSDPVLQPHRQPLSKKRARSQSVTVPSNFLCSVRR